MDVWHWKWAHFQTHCATFQCWSLISWWAHTQLACIISAFILVIGHLNAIVRSSGHRNRTKIKCPSRVVWSKKKKISFFKKRFFLFKTYEDLETVWRHVELRRLTLPVFLMQSIFFYKHKLLLPEYESKNLPVCCSYLSIRRGFWYVSLCGNKIFLGSESKFMVYHYI